ncbi:MAG: arabinose ABC transporter permease [Acetobacteraceae bacterium]|nr:arabinose ABC transporter permease [Acetobacteraceae bacterium]
MKARVGMLAPFSVRAFRFQYPADLLTSFGIEMEILILNWYVLVETGSVLLLTVFGALQYGGTLLAPIIGTAGDRFGQRRVLATMRAMYAALGTTMLLLSASGVLRPVHVFIVAILTGLIRPSDLGIRNALLAESMPPDKLTSGVGVSRTTSDSARIGGALAGAALVAALGMASAYVVIASFYVVGLLLTIKAGTVALPRLHTQVALRVSTWRELQDGIAFVWKTPCLLAAMWLAYLVNMTAFPITSGLLAYVAKDIFNIGQTGLGTLVASFAFGALLGSLTVSMFGRYLRPAQTMIITAVVWHALLLVFVHMPDPMTGRIILVAAGFFQSLSMVLMAIMLLNVAGDRFRGRVMGVRMLAIYGMPVGLLGAGVLIGSIGFLNTAILYCVGGIFLTLTIGVYWWRDLWPAGARGNMR